MIAQAKQRENEEDERPLHPLSQLCQSRRCISCAQSCKSLRNWNNQPLTRFMYMAICGEGCSRKIPCVLRNNCVPVNPKNPSSFVDCINGNCNVREIFPRMFLEL